MGNTASLSRTSSHSRTSKSSLGTRRLTRNEKVIQEKWMDAIANHDKVKFVSLCTPGSTHKYKGAEKSMPMMDMLVAAMDMWDSFPDSTASCDSLEEIRPGIVVIRGFTSRGTHTGKPYGFGPFPRIPATGIEVTEDPCDLTFKIKNGKALSMECDAYSSDMNGPPGWYLKIGGKLNQSVVVTN